MGKKVLIEREVEEKNKLAKIASFLVLIVILSALGITHLLEGISSNVTCNGDMSCVIRDLGSWTLVVIGILISWFFIYLLYYRLFKWKETTEINNKTKKKK